MYIWVVLATFLAMLASFSLSHRADMREIVVAPKAEAAVAKIVQKHKAAIKYMYDYSAPTNGQTRPTYVQGKIANSELEGYLPFGFKNDDKFVSYIYCIDKRSLASGLDAAAVSCDDDYAINYLITFGCVPEKWRLMSTGGPNLDLLMSMRKYMDFGNNFGYSEITKDPIPGDINTTMRIVGKEGTGTQIPQFIIDKNIGADSFKVICATKKELNPDEEDTDDEDVTESCPYCLVYMRPFN